MFYYWVWLSLACWLGALCAAWCLAVLRSSAIFGRRTSNANAARRPTVVIRPCAGFERGLFERLVATASLAEFRPVKIRFAVASRADGAFSVAQRAAEQLRRAGLEAALCVTHSGGPNRKVGQLAAVMNELGDEVAHSHVLIVDSDVDASGADLDRLLCDLDSDDRLGLTWALPVEGGAVSTWGDRASYAALNGSFHAFPLLCAIEPAAAVGKTMAVPAAVLERCGGFQSLVAYLGEDIELSRRVRALGLRVAPAPVLTRSMASGRGLGDVIRRLSRWMKVMRGQRPWLIVSYPIFFFAALLLFIFGSFLAIIATDWPSRAGAALALSALLTRVGFSFVARRRCGDRISVLGAAIDAVLADVTLACAFVSACSSRRLSWRGAFLYIGRDGRLVADDS